MSPPPMERLTTGQWSLLLILAGVQFTNVLDFVVMMPLAIQFQQEWHLTPKLFGLLVASYSLAAAVSGLLSTWFIDRLDRKLSILLIYAGFTISTVGCAVAVTFWEMLLARAAAGAFGGVLSGAILAIVGDVIPMSRRGFATGIIMSSFSLASIFGIPLSLYLAEQYTWRWPFAVLAGLSAGLLVLAWLGLPNFRGHLEHQAPVHNPWKNVWHLLTERNLVRAYILMGVMIITTFMIGPYLPTYLVANVGMPKEHLKWMYLAGGVVTLLLLAPVGRLADRYGKLLVFQVIAVLTALPMLAVTHLPPAPLAVILLVTTAMMAIISARSVPAMALVTACTTPQKRGGFMSVLGSTNQLAMGMATVLAGLILGGEAPEQALLTASSETIPPMEGFPIIGWLSCGLTLWTVYLATRLRGPEGRPLEEPAPRRVEVEAVKALAKPPDPVEIEVRQGL